MAGTSVFSALMWCLFGWIRWYSLWTKLESDISKWSSHRVKWWHYPEFIGMTSKNILLLCAQSEMDYCLWISLQALIVGLLAKMASRNIDSSNFMKLLAGNGTRMLACVVSVFVFSERTIKWRHIKYEILQFVQHYFYSFRCFQIVL